MRNRVFAILRAIVSKPAREQRHAHAVACRTAGTRSATPGTLRPRSRGFAVGGPGGDRAGIHDHGGEGRFDDRRARPRRVSGPIGSKRATVASTQPVAGEVDPPRAADLGVGAGLPPAAPAASSRSRQRTRARQVTSSISDFGSLISKICLWVAWKSLDQSARGRPRRRSGAAQRHLDLPDLVRIARLDREARSSLSSGPAPGPSMNVLHARSSPASKPLTASTSNGRSVVNAICAYSAVRSDISAPAALSAAPTSGMITRRQPSRRATATAFRPAAPPPPTRAALAGRCPG